MGRLRLRCKYRTIRNRLSPPIETKSLISTVERLRLFLLGDSHAYSLGLLRRGIPTAHLHLLRLRVPDRRVQELLGPLELPLQQIRILLEHGYLHLHLPDSRPRLALRRGMARYQDVADRRGGRHGLSLGRQWLGIPLLGRSRGRWVLE